MPRLSTKTNCSGSSEATASRQVVRASSSRTARLPTIFFVGPAQPADGPPHRGFAQLLPLVLCPPDAVLLQSGVGGRLPPCAQRCLLFTSDLARAAGNRLTL